MNILGIVKSASELVVSIGAGAVVGNAIKVSTPANAKLIKKVSIGIGGLVLSNMIGDMAAKYVTHNIDKGVEEVKKIVSATKNSEGENNE